MNPSHEESGAVDIGAVVSGKYRIERELGGSGFARVFRAKNLMLGRDVALKCVRREHLGDAQRVDDFFREARVTHQARHPHVVDVLDVGFHGATPYVVQEFLTGEDLAGYLVRKGAQVPVRAVIERMLPVIDGVAHAHARGMVHGGLRPENVFLARTPDGIIPKVMDFGAMHAAALGAFVGTPAFSSPEQLDGTRELDARSDVWSLGVMLYALVSGCIPFRSTDAASLVEEIRTGEALPLSAAAPSLSPALAEVVDRCLLRDPDARHPDAGALAQALRALPEAPIAPVGGLQIVAPSLAPPPEDPEALEEPVDTFVLQPQLEESALASDDHAPALADEAIDAAVDSIGRPTVYDVPTDEEAHRPFASAASPAEIDLHTLLRSTSSAPPAEDEATDNDLDHELAEDPAQRFDVPGLGGPSRRTVMAAVATLLTLAAFALVWRRVRYGAPRAATPITRVNVAATLPPVAEPASPLPPASAVPEHTTPAVAATSDGGAALPSTTHHVAHSAAPRVTTDGGEESPAPPAAAPHAREGEEPASPASAPETPTSEPASAEGEPTPPEQSLPSASIDPVVEQAVSEHSEAIDRCLEQAQEPRGRVNVRLVIAPNGAVRAATPFAPPALRPVGQCIAREMRTWRIVVPDATEDSIITWPFDLSPSQD
jgi:serine/threonine-protein kinase